MQMSGWYVFAAFVFYIFLFLFYMSLKTSYLVFIWFFSFGLVISHTRFFWSEKLNFFRFFQYWITMRLKLLKKQMVSESFKHTYSWVHNRRVYLFIWHPRNMKKETTQRETKVFNKNPPYSFIWHMRVPPFSCKHSLWTVPKQT